MPMNRNNTRSISAISKRFGITAREARDVVTALGNQVSPNAMQNLLQQVKETGIAATTGKSGTRSAQYKLKKTRRVRGR